MKEISGNGTSCITDRPIVVADKSHNSVQWIYSSMIHTAYIPPLLVFQSLVYRITFNELQGE